MTSPTFRIAQLIRRGVVKPPTVASKLIHDLKKSLEIQSGEELSQDDLARLIDSSPPEDSNETAARDGGVNGGRRK